MYLKVLRIYIFVAVFRGVNAVDGSEIATSSTVEAALLLECTASSLRPVEFTAVFPSPS